MFDGTCLLTVYALPVARAHSTNASKEGGIPLGGTLTEPSQPGEQQTLNGVDSSDLRPDDFTSHELGERPFVDARQPFE